jgi:hypothetical protein
LKCGRRNASDGVFSRWRSLKKGPLQESIAAGEQFAPYYLNQGWKIAGWKRRCALICECFVPLRASLGLTYEPKSVAQKTAAVVRLLGKYHIKESRTYPYEGQMLALLIDWILVLNL